MSGPSTVVVINPDTQEPIAVIKAEDFISLHLQRGDLPVIRHKPRNNNHANQTQMSRPVQETRFQTEGNAHVINAAADWIKD